jgi:hypothetical protein
MNVWMTKCSRQTGCNWCPEPIEKTEHMVVTSYYRGKWLIKKYYHPECWIAQGKEALERRIKVDNRGGVRLHIPPEAKKERRKIAVRRASVIQRIKKAYERNDVDNMIHLGVMLQQLKEEIEPYGGVPKKW